MGTTTHTGVPTRARATDRLAMAHDASHYLLTRRPSSPPRDAAQVAALLRVSAAPACR